MGAPDGEVVGLWFASAAQANDRGLIEAVLYGEDRVGPNTYDDKGGAFVTFGGHRAPGELSR